MAVEPYLRTTTHEQLERALSWLGFVAADSPQARIWTLRVRSTLLACALVADEAAFALLLALCAAPRMTQRDLTEALFYRGWQRASKDERREYFTRGRREIWLTRQPADLAERVVEGWQARAIWAQAERWTADASVGA